MDQYQKVNKDKDEKKGEFDDTQIHKFVWNRDFSELVY
jgi:hypothetical protein